VRRRSHRATLRILCALLSCAPLILEARVAASSEDGSSSVTAVQRVNDGRSTPVSSATGGMSKSRDAVAAALPRHGAVKTQGGVGQLTRSNAERLHSLLSAQARGHTPRPSTHVRSTDGTTGNRVVGTQPSSNPTIRPTLPVSKLPARAAAGTATTAHAVGIDSRIGGPHVAGPGRLGGPIIGRTANNAAIDGMQIRRKF
jgi:hypothetical protein